MDPHFQQLIVTQGNQLHVIYQDGVANDGAVWYAHREVDAPHIERSPLPPARPWPAVTVTAIGITDSVPVERPGAAEDVAKAPAGQLPSSINTAGPLLISLTSVLVFLGVAYSVHTLLRRRE